MSSRATDPTTPPRRTGSNDTMVTPERGAVPTVYTAFTPDNAYGSDHAMSNAPPGAPPRRKRKTRGRTRSDNVDESRKQRRGNDPSDTLAELLALTMHMSKRGHIYYRECDGDSSASSATTSSASSASSMCGIVTHIDLKRRDLDMVPGSILRRLYASLDATRLRLRRRRVLGNVSPCVKMHEIILDLVEVESTEEYESALAAYKGTDAFKRAVEAWRIREMESDNEHSDYPSSVYFENMSNSDTLTTPRIRADVVGPAYMWQVLQKTKAQGNMYTNMTTFANEGMTSESDGGGTSESTVQYKFFDVEQIYVELSAYKTYVYAVGHVPRTRDAYVAGVERVSLTLDTYAAHSYPYVPYLGWSAEQVRAFLDKTLTDPDDVEEMRDYFKSLDPNSVTEKKNARLQLLRFLQLDFDIEDLRDRDDDMDGNERLNALEDEQESVGVNMVYVRSMYSGAGSVPMSEYQRAQEYERVQRERRARTERERGVQEAMQRTRGRSSENRREFVQWYEEELAANPLTL